MRRVCSVADARESDLVAPIQIMPQSTPHCRSQTEIRVHGDRVVMATPRKQCGRGRQGGAAEWQWEIWMQNIICIRVGPQYIHMVNLMLFNNNLLKVEMSWNVSLFQRHILCRVYESEKWKKICSFIISRLKSRQPWTRGWIVWLPTALSGKPDISQLWLPPQLCACKNVCVFDKIEICD